MALEWILEMEDTIQLIQGRISNQREMLARLKRFHHPEVLRRSNGKRMVRAELDEEEELAKENEDEIYVVEFDSESRSGRRKKI